LEHLNFLDQIRLYLDVPLKISHELAIARGEYKSGTTKDIHEQDSRHMERAYNNGKYVADKYTWNVIDCTEDSRLRTIDSIHNDIYNIVKTDIDKWNNR